MILNISERTDIVAFYFDWFLRRLHEGYAYVRNPYDPTKVSKVLLGKESVDCIIFTTKNPLPLEKQQTLLDSFQIPYGIAVTITPYGKEIESHVPDKREVIASFRRLSQKLGKEKMLLRYDPILLNDQYSLAYHTRAFEKLLSQLEDATDTCILSFVDRYRFQKGYFSEVSFAEMVAIAEEFSKIAARHHITLQTCGEKVDLSEFGILKRGCMSKEYIERVLAQPIKKAPSRKTRENCTCLATVDLGVYNTCLHGCCYCYATSNREELKENIRKHDPMSPFLIGDMQEGDLVLLRKSETIKDDRLKLF